ncbi:MAG: pallilysin-related adhesin [Treponema sp.]|jgi:hypothetical protein|nr:pallilysin-related adhesin [Treponema sp.]
MTKKTLLTVSIVLFILLALGAGAFFLRSFGLFRSERGREQAQTRIIIPQETQTGGGDSEESERMAYEDRMSTKVPLEEQEVIVAVLTGDFNEDPMEEQFIAYRNLLEIESPVYLTYAEYDESTKSYRRIWNAATAATRPGTISLYTQDLVGDRSVCVILTGMNGQREHTMTIFRRNTGSSAARTRRPADDPGQPFSRIAELRIDGSILVQETERSRAYQLGHTHGQSFNIAAYGRDYESGNILDQVELTYAFNSANGLYEQTGITRIPGSQIEQRRLKELLSGTPGVFENFISDLWYYVGPEGTVDSRQYIYFDPAKRELVFFGDEAQQVFTWQNSSSTRYGIYISSQNISVTTLRRFLDIELESLDSIRVRVIEDVRLKLGVNNSWDGSYRRAGTAGKRAARSGGGVFSIDALYDSSMGKIRFFRDGTYELSSEHAVQRGRYIFFEANGQRLLELRPLEVRENTAVSSTAGQGNAPQPETRRRELFRVESPGGDAAGQEKDAVTLTLFRVRLGTMGVHPLPESGIPLILVENAES